MVFSDLGKDMMVISDSANNRLVLVDLETMSCETVIGSGQEGHQDGDFLQSSFSSPQGVSYYKSIETGHDCLLVCDTKNHLIREVDLETKKVKTVGGRPTKRGFDRRGGGRLEEQEIASPWDLVKVEGEESRFYVCMAGTH
jgi:hypothetical protein